MSLLDDVSIVVTPNGYKAGTLFAVKPTDALGSELVVNGDFATDSDWSVIESGNDTITIENGYALFNCPDNSNIYISQGGLLTIGKTYTASVDLLSIDSGSLQFAQGGGGTITGSPSINTLGTHTFTFIAATATFAVKRKLGAPNLLNAKIDNVSVKEVTGADMDVTRATAGTRVDENGLVNYAEIIGGEEVTDGDFPSGTTAWTFGAGWSLGTNKAERLVAASSTDIVQASVFPNLTSTFKISFDVVRSAGSIRLRAGTYSLPYVSATDTYIYYVTPVSNNQLKFQADSSFVGSVTNISVKEVTRDNVPRIDYTGGGCPHILAEPQRTNLLKYSEDFSQWAAEESSVSLNTLETLSPDGGNNATILTENTSFGKHGVVVNTTSGGSSYSFSFFAKYKTRQFISIVTSDDVYWQSQVVVNLIDGSITKEFSRSYTITNKVEDFGNGWYKISASINGTYNTRFYSRIYLSNVAVPSDPPNNFYTGESLSAYIWAAQLEVGSYPTSYIPTSGSTVTRNQDIFTRDGIGSLINSTEGVLFAEISRTEDESNYRLLGLDNGTSQNYIKMGFGDISGNFWIRAVVNGVTVINSDNAVSNNANQFYKIAVRYKSGDSVIYIDGVPVLTSSTTFSSGTFTDLDFTHYTGSLNFYGKVKQLQVYNTALIDEQLEALTS